MLKQGRKAQPSMLASDTVADMLLFKQHPKGTKLSASEADPTATSGQKA
jgi:hypothetical protein